MKAAPAKIYLLKFRKHFMNIVAHGVIDGVDNYIIGI
jgi:hypothetical protein